ncbi:MAG: TetR/AcrR family transcriptional regulator [Halieaceae bacterium]|jgi:AcrR family transcriptional regulator|nr:TetR/AcrR family transcriptional regulator [Halieaceae bacterium]
MAKKGAKGQQTAARILDVAEPLFARKGYDATSLREIAAAAGIREPGLYNYFKGKQQLYSAVLDRALSPMAEAMKLHLDSEESLRALADLPTVMTDLLLEHPTVAALFQQALQGDPDSIGNQLIMDWLGRLFAQSVDILGEVGIDNPDRADLVIQTIAMFNLTTGYFLSQRVFEALVGGDITAPENVDRQKKLLAKLQRAMLID